MFNTLYWLPFYHIAFSLKQKLMIITHTIWLLMLFVRENFDRPCQFSNAIDLFPTFDALSLVIACQLKLTNTVVWPIKRLIKNWSFLTKVGQSWLVVVVWHSHFLKEVRGSSHAFVWSHYFGKHFTPYGPT